jgi:hypothetical protein
MHMFSAIDEGSIGHVTKKILVYDIERDDLADTLLKES